LKFGAFLKFHEPSKSIESEDKLRNERKKV
jgi:hypothetical protein